MFPTTDPGERVEKLMSFTRKEFETGLERLTAGAVRLTVEGGYDLSAAAGGKAAVCLFEPQPDAVLGGLVRLPRVRVTLLLETLSPDERLAFVTEFEKTFQRGGG